MESEQESDERAIQEVLSKLPLTIREEAKFEITLSWLARQPKHIQEQYIQNNPEVAYWLQERHEKSMGPFNQLNPMLRCFLAIKFLIGVILGIIGGILGIILGLFLLPGNLCCKVRMILGFQPGSMLFQTMAFWFYILLGIRLATL